MSAGEWSDHQGFGELGVEGSGWGMAVLGAAGASLGSAAMRDIFKAPMKQTAPAMAARIASQRMGRRQRMRWGRSSLKVLPI